MGFDGNEHSHDARADLFDDRREAGAPIGVTRHGAFVEDEVDGLKLRLSVRGRLRGKREG